MMKLSPGDLAVTSRRVREWFVNQQFTQIQKDQITSNKTIGFVSGRYFRF